ncbi:MAG: tryptophan synthase subunit alpha [Candidatus Atribacteria bacterium]|nr:tryptophan synthase subunit alpha [Candidatus Atribacteria bacterium]
MTDHLAESLSGKQKKLFLPYLTFGYPDVHTFLDLVRICRDQGADAIEIGIPHSDPVADGPVLQHASYQALQNGVTPRIVAETLGKAGLGVPLIAMTYGNIVYHYGVERFGRDFREAGFQGLIVADFPLEARPFLQPAAEDLSIIILASTNTSPERLAAIGKESRGFVYLVSGKGTTGNTHIETNHLPQMVNILRAHISIPLLIGFGVSSPDVARSVGLIADGVIVGTAIMKVIIDHHSEPDFRDQFSRMIGSFRNALDEISRR